MLKSLTAACGVLALAVAAPAFAADIQGDYIEARTADVFTGPCFSNSEVYITGHQAVVAWKVRQGSWQGVDLSGLSVAAAIRGTTTFSEDNPAAARAVLIVDERATPAQRAALIALAKTLAGERLAHVVAVKTSLINLTVEDHVPGAPAASEHKGHALPQAPQGAFWAPDLAEIVTRPLTDTDHLCGNEVVAYQPLSKGVTAQPAYTLGNRFKGKGLNTTWDDQNCRGSFVGHFAY
jgi:hypothetical protein